MKTETWLAYLDQFRYITGTLVIAQMLCRGALPRRSGYRLRVFAGGAVCLLLALAYVPISAALRPLSARHPLVIGPYWLVMSLVPVAFILTCYETNLAGALFRTMMMAFSESLVSLIIRNLFVYTFFPDFPRQHPAAYVLLLSAVYAVYCLAIRLALGRRIRADEMARLTRPRHTAGFFLFLYLTYTALLSTAKYVMEVLVLPFGEDPAHADIYRLLQLYLVDVLLAISLLMMLLLWYLYQRVATEAEKEVILRLARDRKAQYEFSREYIEMINRKTHDLKHQLQALEMVSGEEREKQLEETRRAVSLYDAAVKTGNEALDILLTEKNVYCANRRIRLSCTVHTGLLDKIRLVDLYTLLGNALDNAIESTERLDDPEKKVISLSIQDRGGMLCIQLENYFDGVLSIRSGLPQTRKADTDNHGYGLKSIRSLAAAYGGRAEIRTEGEIFFLDILIP